MKSLLTGLFALALAGTALAEQVENGRVAELRALDRLSGELTEFMVPAGSEVVLDRLRIGVIECRYPVNNPAGDAYAFLLIRSTESGDTLFEGWMVASSPALNAFDHMRYDVWVIRCTNS
ncbi:DUF2155 domain-containing protein [Fluviibacterium sp. DFM31]|uniref:DUF2155 domain-containing protein n=1 Tax=Meridianimarinicoccus marinus TaxID=3231483 RepID=A0ABV3LA99_9RHOB